MQAATVAENGNRIVITVEQIANDRDAFNISGTLSLELWALSQPYHGGGFSGHSLAATELGEVNGQYCLRNGRYELDFRAPPAGTWTLVLMLREWEDGAFTTRDHVNFAVPYTVAAPRPAVSRQDGGKIIEVSFRDTNPQATSAPEATAAPVAALQTTAAATPEPAATAGTAAKAGAAAVSVNRASAAELAAIKGLSATIARAIVDNRPYKALKDLLKVKGLGKKTLENLEGKISL